MPCKSLDQSNSPVCTHKQITKHKNIFKARSATWTALFLLFFHIFVKRSLENNTRMVILLHHIHPLQVDLNIRPPIPLRKFSVSVICTSRPNIWKIHVLHNFHWVTTICSLESHCLSCFNTLRPLLSVLIQNRVILLSFVILNDLILLTGPLMNYGHFSCYYLNCQ